MRLYLDCEWADLLGSELVSLGLVSEDNAHRFYAELVPLPTSPTDFVRSVVYPLLQGGLHARGALSLTRDLRDFLGGFEDSEVIYDYHVDGSLLRYALDGFEQPDSLLATLPPLPAVRTRLISESADVHRRIEQYFSDRPDAARRRHHALVDAEALRWACCPPTRSADELACGVPIRGDGAYVIERDIPLSDREAFWAFTGATSAFAAENGLAIPASAWREYLAWLSEPESDPSRITSSTKFEWRRRTGGWV